MKMIKQHEYSKVRMIDIGCQSDREGVVIVQECGHICTQQGHNYPPPNVR